MSATGHQVLSFVTSAEMLRRLTTTTGAGLALEEITEAKDIGCVVEVVMPAVANSLGSTIPQRATIKTKKVTANTVAYS